MKSLFISLIRFYMKVLSPLKKPCCRFVPTCSEYALISIERFGVFRGGVLALYRILRCNPFCKGGYDPVPSDNDDTHA